MKKTKDFKIYTQYQIRMKKEQQDKDLLIIALACSVIVVIAAGLLILN